MCVIVEDRVVCGIGVFVIDGMVEDMFGRRFVMDCMGVFSGMVGGG